MLKDNFQLKKLFEADQKDRRVKKIDWKVVSARDLEREKKVYAAIKEGKLKTAADYYHAAMILQHGQGVEPIKLAKKYARLAMKLGDKRGKWLYAASTDRILMRMNKAQKFGTQYYPIFVQAKNGSVGQKLRLYPIQRKTTDATRKEYDVPTLKELRKREN